jgi:hypothetical protein
VPFKIRTGRMCPAIILAASRTLRVTGRIKALISSIPTIRAIRGIGQFWGVR